MDPLDEYMEQLQTEAPYAFQEVQGGSTPEAVADDAFELAMDEDMVELPEETPTAENLANFVASQAEYVTSLCLQKDQEPPSLSQSVDSLKNLLSRDPCIFLERYGRLLTKSHLRYFSCMLDNYEIDYYVKLYTLHPETEDMQRIRNRRFNYIPQLDREGYFTNARMQQRQPALYNQYLGKLDPNPSAPSGDNVKLSEMICWQFEKTERDIRQHEEESNWKTEEEAQGETDTQDYLDDNTPGDQTDYERAREELLSIMKKRFLDGKDSDFVDYAGIDSNSSLDDLKQIQQDAEDRWFDEELPAPCDDLRVR